MIKLLLTILLSVSLSAQHISRTRELDKVGLAVLTIWFHEMEQINQLGNLYPEVQYRPHWFTGLPEPLHGWGMMNYEYWESNVGAVGLQYDFDSLHDPWIAFLFFIAHLEQQERLEELTTEDMFKIHYAAEEYQTSYEANLKWQSAKKWAYMFIFSY